MPRKKPVPAFVPQASIRWLMGRVHVGTPDAEVEADMRRRCAKTNATEQEIAAIVAFAIACHRENQGLYNAVMSGRFGR
jgi:Na+-transporting methylmalonyl-CoA/oxaloacetate decarboxylase gamma subunit